MTASMLRLSVLLVALTACTDPEDTGVELPACQDCSPGAILGGRFFETNYGPRPVVANRQGSVALVLGNEVRWLDSTFAPAGSHSVGDQMITSISLADDGSTAVASGDYFDEDFVDQHYRDASIISLAPDHSQRGWRASLGTISGATVSASPDIVLVQTDATQINGTSICDSPHYCFTLAALRASDGTVLWHKPLVARAAFAPDGTLVMAGTFTGTLDLGGAAAPMTAIDIDLFIAALDPLTGEARWALQLDGGTSPQVGPIAASETGDVAVALDVFDTGVRAVTVMLLDSTGTTKWSRTMSPMSSLVTDGEHVIIGQGDFAQYSANGFDWKQPVTSTGIELESSVLALAGDRLIGWIHTGMLGPADSTTTIGDVSYTGDGEAAVELAH